jgi:hypothetical protein
MFDPVLPVTIIGSRTNPSDLFKGEKLSRISRGLPFRLNRKLRGRPRAVHKDEISMSLDRGMGEVKVRLWVVHWPEGIHKTAKSARESFLPPNSEPILFTNSGQTIESLSSAWFRREVEFGLVSEGIVMDISLDNLDHKVKASLVGGNRKMVRNQVYDEIVAHIVDRLRKDEKLKRIEDEFRNRRVVREIIDAELIRRLGELIDTQIKIPSGSVRITGSGGAKVGGSDESELPRENDLPLLPTRIICEPPQIMLHQGSSKSFTIDIDAKEGLLDQEGNNLELVWEGDTSGITTSRGALKNGRIGCHVKAGPGVVTGERTLTVRLVLAERTLENSISVEVKEPEHKSKKKQVRKVKSPPRGPNIQWVFEEDWPEHDWDAYDIGKTEFSPDSTTIFLNRHSEICKEYADSAIDKTERAIVRRENEWILRVGFGVFKIHYYNDKVLAEGSDRMTDEQMTLSKRVLAEAIATSVR